jgi:hypothetical protein
MKRKIIWIAVSCLIALSLVMASCGPVEAKGVEVGVGAEEVEVEFQAEEEEEEDTVSLGMYIPLMIFSVMILLVIAGAFYVRRRW